jgi:hypothetical protein
VLELPAPATLARQLIVKAKLVQAGTAKGCHIMVPVGVVFERHLVREPSKRNIWLSAAQLTERARGDFCLSGHAGSSGEQTVATDVIASQTYCRHNAIVKRR